MGPERLVIEEGGQTLVLPAGLKALLPWPETLANKYSRGHCVLFAGMERFGGAAVLATRAALRSGAGYVQVYTAGANVPLVRAAAPSAVTATWNAGVLGHLADAGPDRPLAYVVGPGFDPDDVDCRQVTLAALRAAAAAVVDGGALGVLAVRQARAVLESRAAAGHATVLTPHAGEAARLAHALGLSPEPEGAALAAALAEALQVSVLLKGPITYLAHEGRVITLSGASAGLARAGSGDVLAGILGGLLCQGMNPVDACVLAYGLHAFAGLIAEERFTTICMTPEDVTEAIPDAVKLIASLE